MPWRRDGKDDDSVAFRLPLPWPGNPLFDDLAAEIGVNLTFLGPCNGFAQDLVFDPFLPGKALKTIWI
jgi:hypothetical protein